MVRSDQNTNMVDFQTEFTDAVNARKGDIADAVGMPDEKDLEVLTRIIGTYKRWQFTRDDGVVVTGEHLIRVALERGRQQFQQGIHGKNLRHKGQAEVSADSRMRYAFELPDNLGFAIEAVFPTLFRSKKHLRWFASKFPELTIAGKKL